MKKIFYLFVMLLFVFILFPAPIYTATASVPVGLNGDGDLIELYTTGGADHYLSVNSSESDFVYNSVTAGGAEIWKMDLYECINSTDLPLIDGNETVVSVTLTARCCICPAHFLNGYVNLTVKTDGVIYYSTMVHIDSHNQIVTWTLTENPGTGEAWTWSNITDMQVGIDIIVHDLTGLDMCSCDYYTVEVDYVEVQTETPISDGENSGVLSGSLISSSLTDLTCGFWYSTNYTDADNFEGNVSATGTYDDGETFTYTVNSLNDSEYYFVRAWSSKTGYDFFQADNERCLLTKPQPPSNVLSKATENNITVTWNNASINVTNQTSIIRYDIDISPTTLTDGTEIYNGTAKTVTLNYFDLDNGDYYFTGWTFINETGIDNLNQFSINYTTVSININRPKNLDITEYNDTKIVLTWDKGYDDTVIVRNTTEYPLNNKSGTEIYNGSLETYTDTNIEPNTNYYYRAWNWNNTHNCSEGYTNTTCLTTLQPPQNVTSDVTVVGDVSVDITFTWDNGTGSNRTVIRRSYTSQPVTPTDGTEIYNSTLNTTTDAGIIQPAFYTAFSYNTTLNTFSIGVNVSWYVVWINCYDEDTGDAIPTYNLLFSNPDGTETYYAEGASNPHLVNVSDIPLGDDISLHVSADDYNTRRYSFDIIVTGIFYIDVYLPSTVGDGEPPDDTTDCTLRYFTDSITITNPSIDNTITFTYYLEDMGSVEIYNETQDLGSYWITVASDKYTYTNSSVVIDASVLTSETKMARCTYYYWDCEGTYTRLYFIQVTNELNQPIQDAEVSVRKYINATEQYENLSILYTDGYGYASVWLIPNSNIKLYVSADGYQEQISEWLPDPVYYGMSYPKIIQLLSEEYETTPQVIYPTFTGDKNGNYINVTYYDAEGNTTDTQLYVYEINLSTGNTTLFYNDSWTNNNSFTINLVVNSSNSYEFILYYNHSVIGSQTMTLIFDCDYTPFLKTDLESLFVRLIGDNPFGWLNTTIFIFLILGMFYADKRDAGKVMVLLGGLFLFINIAVGIESTLFTVAGGVIPSLFIVVGVVIMWNDSKKGGR